MRSRTLGSRLRDGGIAKPIVCRLQGFVAWTTVAALRRRVPRQYRSLVLGAIAIILAYREGHRCCCAEVSALRVTGTCRHPLYPGHSPSACCRRVVALTDLGG